MRILLNLPQLNSLVIALRMFEENLRQADMWLKDDLPGGLLYQYTRRLPAERVAAARAEVAAALQDIAALAQELEAAPATEPIEARIAAAMSVSWANLCDVKSARLVRYGSVDNGLGDLLDSRIDALSQHALRIAALLGEEA